MFTPDVYISRRKKLMERVAGGLILLLGNEESSMNYPDNAYPFRQDSTFLYYIGIDRPGLAALIDPEHGSVCVFGNGQSLEEIIWTGPVVSLQQLANASGIEEVMKADDLPSLLQKALSLNRNIHFLPPYRSENKLKLKEWLSVPVNEQSGRASVTLIKAVVAQRSIKSPAEVIEIEKAVNISIQMQRCASAMAMEGQTEMAIAGAVEGIAVSVGGRLAFPSIITVNGQVLHNHHQKNVLKPGQMLLCDCGAETPMHYSGDLTRTTPVNQDFGPRQKEIYSIVLSAHEAAIKQLRPGVRFLDVHLHACTSLATGLKDLGLMKGDIDEAVQAGAHAMFFQCGLGHLLGLDTHDMEDLGEQYTGYTSELKKSNQFGLRSLRLARELSEGFVLTVEPGIYIIPELIDLWKSENRFSSFINYQKLEEYRDFGGIRVEDDLLITATGHRVLGEPLPWNTPELKKNNEIQG